MADNFFMWSATDTSNSTVDGTSVATGMSPANVDNVFRKLMAAARNTFSSALQNFLAGTAALPVANGGTGATSSANALTSLGALSSTYRDLPVTTKSSSYTIADAERAGLAILDSASAQIVTLNPNATTDITDGAVYVLFNNNSGSWTVTRGSGVFLFKNGSTTSADAIIAPGGQATLMHLNNDLWTINGVGVS